MDKIGSRTFWEEQSFRYPVPAVLVMYSHNQREQQPREIKRNKDADIEIMPISKLIWATSRIF